MMKNFLILVGILGLAITSCKEGAKGGDAKGTTSAEGDKVVEYALDTDSSMINWWGYKVTDGQEGGHYGNVKFESQGQFSTDNGQLKSGSFTVNMGSLQATDIDEDGGKSKLEAHLKEKTFFNTTEYPTAKFEITKVTPLESGDYNTEIEGNFTIKDSIKNYTFQANTMDLGDSYSIKSNDFMINRKDFNIVHENAVKDAGIKDDLKLQVVIVGKKK